MGGTSRRLGSEKTDKECSLIEAKDALRVPRERAAAARRRALAADRVEIFETGWAQMAEFAGSLGVEVPETEASPSRRVDP